MEILKYFGTGLKSAGHYFWILDNYRMDEVRIDFSELDFDTYGRQKDLAKGTVTYLQTGKFSALTITGSCTDNRLGTVSVFFVEKLISEDELKQIILSTPIAMTIINQMKFPVRWN